MHDDKIPTTNTVPDVPLTSDVRPTPASKVRLYHGQARDVTEPQPTEGDKAFNPEVIASAPHVAGSGQLLNSAKIQKEKPHKEQYDIDLVYGEADTRSKVDADDSLSQSKRSTNSNCLHTIAVSAPRSALAGQRPPKKGLKVHFPKYFINKARMHESKYRRPLQPTRQ